MPQSKWYLISIVETWPTSYIKSCQSTKNLRNYETVGICKKGAETKSSVLSSFQKKIGNSGKK